MKLKHLYNPVWGWPTSEKIVTNTALYIYRYYYIVVEMRRDKFILFLFVLFSAYFLNLENNLLFYSPRLLPYYCEKLFLASFLMKTKLIFLFCFSFLVQALVCAVLKKKHTIRLEKINFYQVRTSSQQLWYKVAIRLLDVDN